METKVEDAADAVATTSIRHYWGSGCEYTDDELFALARHQWGDSRGSDNAAKDFVLQVAAGRLEEQLLLWLLQSHSADAAKDMQALIRACTDPYFTVAGVELVRSMLDALSTAAVVRASACERSAEDRKRRMAELLERMEGAALKKSRGRSILRALQKCDTGDEDAGAWAQFLGLPHVLDPRVFNSRSGRAFMDEAGQVISLQQAELAAVRLSFEGYDNAELEGEEQKVAAKVLWDLATQVLELVNGKAESSDDVQDDDEPWSDSTLVVVKDMMDLETYLKAKEPSTRPYANGFTADEIDFDGGDVELSAIEQLSSICRSAEGEQSISCDILEKVFEELSAVKSLDVVAIQASFLLGLQLHQKLCFFDLCESARDEFERRVRRVFNRLTGKARDLEHVASLVILAAFCPGQVIRQCIRGARTDVLHHRLYLKVFYSSPLLLDWNEGSGDGTRTLLECELQRTLLEVSGIQSNFDRESQNVMRFLLSLVGISNSTSSGQRTPVMTVSKLLDAVINPLWCCADQRTETQLNLYTLTQQFVQQLVTVRAEVTIYPATLTSSFNLVLSTLRDTKTNEPRSGVLVRERLLLLLKNIMELMPDAASTATLEEFERPINPSLWTLLGLFNSELGNDELCEGLEDVVAVEGYIQDISADDSSAPLQLPNVISAVQVLLWGLLWDSKLSKTASVESTKAETWRLLDAIARHDFLGTNTEQTMKGSLLIQSAVAEMMLECGSILFQALLVNIIPYLLGYESTEPEEERLAIPKWAADKLPDQPKVEQQIPCQLVSTHSIMRYVTRCWSLSGAVNIQLASPPNALLVESLSHVISAHDQAITSSQSSLSGTLFCTQWLCFLVSTTCELHLDELPTWITVRTQFELSLLRLLHQLGQLKGTSDEKALFSQYFVAAWLAYLPAGQFYQVFNFIASRASK